MTSAANVLITSKVFKFRTSFKHLLYKLIYSDVRLSILQQQDTQINIRNFSELPKENEQ